MSVVVVEVVGGDGYDGGVFAIVVVVVVFVVLCLVVGFTSQQHAGASQRVNWQR